MQLDSVLGNGAAVSSLKTALLGGKLAHAVLITAPPGAGTGFIARCLAADFLFPAGGAGVEAVLEGRSPEVMLVQGEGKSGNIKVDRVREIRRDVFHSSLSAAGRVVIIREAQRMAAPAANALLKVLEEPPPGVLFLLTCHDAAALMETIRSRCALYPFAPPSIEECTAALQRALPAGEDAALPALLATVYGGRIGAGLAALSSPARLATLQDAIGLAVAAGTGDAYGLLLVFAGYEARDKKDENTQSARRAALLADFTDILACGLRGLTAPGLPALPPSLCAALLPAVSEARSALVRNGAPKITFTALAARLARAGKAA